MQFLYQIPFLYCRRNIIYIIHTHYLNICKHIYFTNPLKYIILWVLVYSQIVQPSSQSNFRTFSSSLKEIPHTRAIRSNYIYFTLHKRKKASIKYMYDCIFDIANAKENHKRNSKGGNMPWWALCNFVLATSPSIWVRQVVKSWYLYPTQIIVGQMQFQGLLGIAVFTTK